MGQPGGIESVCGIGQHDRRAGPAEPQLSRHPAHAFAGVETPQPDRVGADGFDGNGRLGLAHRPPAIKAGAGQAQESPSFKADPTGMRFAQ